MTSRAVVYCRVSTEDQADEGTSLETQRLDGLALAERLSLEVPEGFVISEVMSGAKFDERVGIQQVRSMILRGEVQVVIAQKVDRISRQPMHFYSIYDLAQRNGVRFEWTDQTFANSPDGQMLLGLMVVFAQRELEMIRERTQRGVRARVEKDLRPIPGVRAPFGYRWVDEKKTKLEQDPVNGPFFRNVLLQLASGVSANSIANQLNKQGVATPSGKSGAKWTSANIAKMATHPAYYGAWEVWRKSRVQDREVTSLSGVVTDPLIDVETWMRIQDRLSLNKAESSRNNHEPFEALLRAGIARCGYCGNAAQASKVKTKKGYDRFYRCNPTNALRYGCKSFYVRCSELDNEVWSFVKMLLNDPDLVERQLREREGKEAQHPDLAPLRRHLEDLSKRKNRLVDDLSMEENASLRRVLRDKLEDLMEQYDATESELTRLETEEAELKIHHHSLRSMLDVMKEFNSRLEHDATYEIKRAALRMLDVRVELFNHKDVPDRWNLSYSFLGEPRVDKETALLINKSYDSYPQGWYPQKMMRRIELWSSQIDEMKSK